MAKAGVYIGARRRKSAQQAGQGARGAAAGGQAGTGGGRALSLSGDARAYAPEGARIPPDAARMRRRTRPAGAAPVAPDRASASGATLPNAPLASRWKRLGAFSSRSLLAVGLTAGIALGVVGYGLGQLLRPPPPEPMTEEAFDRQLARSLETATLPATAARAWEIIRPSVVQVYGFADPPPRKEAAPRGRSGRRAPPPPPPPAESDEALAQGTGTGVVIVDEGIILTNLHVVAGATRIKVVFDGGAESDAVVMSTQPENDLAVLRARTLPDDLIPATLRSTGDLGPGDRVVAVGFPFGIGPSVSAGVISGMRREYRSEQGENLLSNLIQFDAAANPGNSGGPLVTDEGEVVGIVTGILNPVGQRFFVGIGFAVPIENAVSGLGLPPF